MSQSLYLEMPQTPPHKKLSRRMGLMALALILLAVAGGLLYWLAGGKVQSSEAMLDGMVAVVTPSVSGKLLQLNVKAGDNVVAGQAVGRVDTTAYMHQVQRAAGEVAALRPPDMQEMAARLKAAEDAEKAMVTRIAAARHEEVAAEQVRQDRVTAHVRAQLALRSLDAQGGEAQAGKTTYAKARQEEAMARARMEQSAEAFNELSRRRAALEQELGRIRDEVLYAKQVASAQRYSAQGKGLPLAATQVDGTLYAPANGRVLEGQASVGQTVQAGQPVVSILPQGADTEQAYWVMASFTAEAGRAIRAGQPCTVILQDGSSLGGTVDSVQEAGAVAAVPRSGSQVRSAVGGAGAVTVRALLNEQPAAGAGPGQAVQCVVHTRSILGFGGL